MLPEPDAMSKLKINLKITNKKREEDEEKQAKSSTLSHIFLILTKNTYIT